MGIGVGIFLVAIGAILSFAIEDNVRNVDLYAVGWILMLAGAFGVLLDLLIFMPRRRTIVDAAPSVVAAPPVVSAAPVVEEYRVYDDGRRRRY